MSERFTDVVALITGAGSGIGRAVAQRLVQEGASVFAVDVNAPGLEETRASAPDRMHMHLADLSDPDACVAAVTSCVEQLGRLDVLGNVAGIYRASHTTDMSREQYRQVMSVNLDAPFFLTQAALPHLLASGGNVVNIASNSGVQGVPYSAAYSMTKGGVISLTRSLAVELIKTPVRVNAIAPAGVLTNIAAGASFPTDADPDLLRRMAGMRGLAQPDEVAALFAFLASSEARSVTGAVYTLDNGITVS